MLRSGANLKRFEDSNDSALSFIKQIVKKFEFSRKADSRKEMIIPVMGVTGAGKSTFINYLVQDNQQKFDVGSQLTSCTSEVRSIKLHFPNDPFLQQYTAILVDTPGFNDTYMGDTPVPQRIADWLAKAHRDKKVLGGVIYLHDISSDRFSGTEKPPNV
ncbi:hypothetical protein CPC08DRAFT_765909 [Agrocybe pediades]|nr:hypothetical protein CPC08DRAFT_765909 [Agrocybe pediades]